jgi:hypothetical protein
MLEAIYLSRYLSFNLKAERSLVEQTTREAMTAWKIIT